MKRSAAIAGARAPDDAAVDGGPAQPSPPPRQAPRAAAEAEAALGLDLLPVRLCRRYARLAGIGAAAIGGVVLLGWSVGLPSLARVNPAWVTTKGNTAIAFLAAGLGLFLAAPDGQRNARAVTARICAGFVAAVGFATLAEYALGQDFGIDQLLVTEPVGAIGTEVRGRMAEVTAGNFVLVGSALLARTTRRGAFVSRLLALLVLAYSVVVLAGYLFGAEKFYQLGHTTAVAFPTAVGFLLLATGLLSSGAAGLTGRVRPAALSEARRRTARSALYIATAPYFLAVLCVVAVTIVCFPLSLKHQVGNTTVALAMLLVVQSVATLGARWPALFASTLAALAYDYFFLPPVYTFIIESAQDWMTLGAFFITAVTVGELSGLAKRRAEAAETGTRIAQQASTYNRALIEASLDPLVTISAGGKITDVNRATEHATGHARGELVGTDFADYFTEPERARAGYEQVLSAGSVVNYPLAIRHPTGRITDVLYNASLYHGETGEVAGVFAAARDITERKRAEDQMRASEQRYRTLVDAINDGLMLVDDSAAMTYVNANFAQMLGYPEAALVGHRAPEFMDEASDRLFSDAMERRKAGIAERYELTFVRRDGRPLPALLSARPIFDREGRYRGSLAVVADLTEIKRAERELQEHRQHLEELVATRTADLSKANALLEAANKELEAFSYSVSHDLRVPLRAIDGFSRILLEDYGDKLDAEGQRVINVVRDGAQRMGRLIDDILAFSRVGRLEMARAPIDMDATARAALEDLGPAMAGRNLSVEIKPLPAAFGDAAMMQRVWANLLDNAIKFTAPKAPATIEIGGRSEGDELVYYVKDNGVGFDMQYVGKLFGVFQRLHGVDEFPGTGIGLAIVKRIVGRHGGRVWAEGRLNEGATFYFTLPAREVRNG